jgi:hypothetical protein
VTARSQRHHRANTAVEQRAIDAAIAAGRVTYYEERLAVVFSADDRIRYVEKGEGFPHTCVWSHDVVPALTPRPRDGSELTNLDEVSPEPWLFRPDGVTLFAQTLYQADGYAMTLLLAEWEDNDENDGTGRPTWAL